MQFAYSDKVEGLRLRLTAFMEEHVYPNERRFEEWLAAAPDRWGAPPLLLEELKEKAQWATRRPARRSR